MVLPERSFSIFGFSIYWYGVIVAAGILTAILYCAVRAKKYGLTGDKIVDLAIFIIPSAIIGARLYYVIFSWDQFSDNLWNIFNIRSGGLAIYGGVIGAVIAGAILCKVKKIPFLKLCDLVAPSLALGQAIGRWGNFVNQEAYGVAITNPQIQFFPIAVWIEHEGAWHMATFFYESAACVLIFLFLRWFSQRTPMPRAGNVALFYGLLYGVERAVVEGFRLDSLYMGNIRASQALSILLALACLATLIVSWRRAANATIEIDPNLVMRRTSAEAEAEDPIESPEESTEKNEDGDAK